MNIFQDKEAGIITRSTDSVRAGKYKSTGDGRNEWGRDEEVKIFRVLSRSLSGWEFRRHGVVWILVNWASFSSHFQLNGKVEMNWWGMEKHLMWKRERCQERERDNGRRAKWKKMVSYGQHWISNFLKHLFSTETRISLFLRAFASNHTIIQSYSNTIIQSYSNTIILSCIHTIIYSCSNTIIQSYNHTVIQSYNHTVIQSYCHASIQSYIHAAIQSYNHTVKHTYNHVVIQSYNHTFMQQYNHTVIQSYNHTIMQ